MDSILIRALRYEELDACAKVIRDSFATVADNFGLTEQNCPTNGAFIRTERLVFDRDKGAMMYGLFVHNELAGFLQLMEKETGVFELEKLAVLPKHRHAGYGTRLVSFAADTARTHGGRKITIGIIDAHAVLKNWYLQQGFVPVGTREFAHLPFVVGFMELALS